MICAGVCLVIGEILARSVFHSTLYGRRILRVFDGRLDLCSSGYTPRDKGHIRMTFFALSAVIPGQSNPGHDLFRRRIPVLHWVDVCNIQILLGFSKLWIAFHAGF